ncbi:amidohydrolase family protein [Marinicella gelatinilytica]|uniref:amidohydrolase family protein n=1 Tax=Marinicella gelatinilytica TaxID=2996017 RepID=UPI002260D91A|nr:amidohydrolase family protein [Marinicella gelatinilytica]MCX7544736.1 amidohydrolase family protein [Marinicella gelatinilytica]
MKKILILVLFSISVSVSGADIPTATVNGVQDMRNTVLALTHVNVQVTPDKLLQDVTLIIKNGQISDYREDNQPPKNAVVLNYQGLYIYPGFIHLDSDAGLPEPAKRPPFSWGGPETLQSTTQGAYNANEAIKASYNAADDYKHNQKVNKSLRQAGFTSALSHRHDGIMRGTGLLVSLADEPAQLTLLSPQASQHFSFNKGSSKQNYPVSLMGAVALIRQTLLDAEWYQQQNMMTDLDLAVVNSHKSLPAIFEVNNWQQALLTKKLADEFNLQFTVKTSGDSYQSIESIAKTGQTLIVPLNYPKAPEVNSPLDSYHVDYTDLKEWQVAPFNTRLLADKEVRFALLPGDGDKGLKTFFKDLRKAVEHGLSEKKALAALTTVPAEILKRQDIGHLNKGARADFIVVDQPIFHKEAQLKDSWINGERMEIEARLPLTEGDYTLSLNNNLYGLNFSFKKGQLNIKPTADSDHDFSAKLDGQLLSLVIDEQAPLMAWVNQGEIKPLPSDNVWSLIKAESLSASDNNNQDKQTPKTPPNIPNPFTAYGLADTSTPDKVLFKNATVWTNEDQGIVENTDVLVVNGKIKRIGQNIADSQADLLIDASGKHLTSGIIDEHSHIALLSVNDVAVNSSMVRMQDVVNSQDVNIYRNLAGGVIAAQLLHGSANPIGGQSALVKMRWGVSPQEMLIDGADGFIKFALGENVKNARNNQSLRYPLTRMGVEQVYRDQFSQAQQYQKAWQDYNDLSRSKKKNTTPPRRDLAMEATAEVINQERYISCHSYVQSEISMLMHVADDFDFQVNTFTHILEGYKVADQMKAHGVGASTFADWWAYKWEVNEAIPYNAAIMDDVGLVTAINSDSAEMSRRLNQEAAKTIKYGGLSEQEAWKTVTLNPAKLLHLDNRMGSIKEGKDADLVLWSDKPLSVYAQAEKTMVDGIIYFDRNKQAALEQQINDEKMDLIKQSQTSGETKKSDMTASQPTLHCDTLITQDAYLQLNNGAE